MAKKLTSKQERFVEEYLVDLNATQAAIRSGYSKKTATAIGAENLTKPDIADAIAAARKELSEKTGISAERVLAELAKIGFSNMQDYIRVTGDDIYVALGDMSRDEAAAIGEVTVEERKLGNEDEGKVTRTKFKLLDKRAALNDLGRHLGLFEADNTRKVSVGGMEDLLKMVDGKTAKPK